MSSKIAEHRSDNADSEVLVSVENVGKVFCRNFKKSLLYGLKDSVNDLFGWRKDDDITQRSLREGEFWANKGINFQLRRGECLGLIGRNGAGKTTLLKMLNGLVKPDSGKITLNGRVGAMIALGAGFNPVLTGKENIYVNGSVLGLSKESIDAKIDEIIDFAEIHDFIDSPVQNYSSGMQVRLGFAVAVILIKPDILFLDEVLAVGDRTFRVKCLRAIKNMSKNAGTIFVSHDMYQISSICNRVLLLKDGAMECISNDVGRVLNDYSLSGEQTSNGRIKGNNDIHVIQINNEPFNEKTISKFHAGDHVEFKIAVPLDLLNEENLVRFQVLDTSMNAVVQFRDPRENSEGQTHIKYSNADSQDLEEASHADLHARIENLKLADGVYSIELRIVDRSGMNLIYLSPSLFLFEVSGYGSSWCKSIEDININKNNDVNHTIKK
ncbi:hypothetical protein NT6N_26640 [Oceaniferula spumae]|uniref:ABC transporter domain-containing protein n=1 Tax=Oceaniferula spumae TaxID=2979115 RepID=A0AAT9FNZ8_9BACT